MRRLAQWLRPNERLSTATWFGTWLIGLWAAANLLAADPTSMQEFVSRSDQWEQLIGSTFVLEGRVSSIAGRDLRMRGTDLRFVLAEDFERPRTAPVVRLVGQLERSGSGLLFKVTTFDRWKRESEIVSEQLRVARGAGAEKYFELAEWLDGRAAFYEDSDLRQQARELRSRGVAIAQKRLPIDKQEEFLALVDQARRWGLPDSQQMDLRHNAIRSELHVESRKRLPEYSMVLNKVRTQFPGAEARLDSVPEKLKEDYERNPVATYSESSDEVRPVLHRLLFIETAIRMFEQETKPDGSNGEEIAARILRMVPERADLAEALKSKEMNWLDTRVPTMDRAEVLEYRNRLRAQGKKDEATQMVRRWINARLDQRRKGAATEVDRAAMEYDMVEDPQRALAILTSALQVDPETPGGKELLDRMGYGWHQSKAVLKQLIPPPPKDPFIAAIEAGQILVGMSDRQVSAAIGGGPESVVRLASQTQVTELWHYPSQRLTILFEATTTHPLLKVARVIEQSPALD